MAIYELTTGWLFRLLSFAFWGHLYLSATQYFPEKGEEWSSRVITLLHGSVATLAGFNQCGVFERCVYSEQFTGKVRPMQYALMLWSWGYFAFDLLWCITYWPDALLMLFHHICALVAITIYMFQDYTGCTFACTLVLLEVTNPLLQIRWFLKKEGYSDTIWFLGVEVLYLTMFFFLRGVLGTYLIYHIMKTDLFRIEHKVLSICLYIVSIAFLYDIFGYVLHKYKREINIGYEEFAAFWHTNCLTFNERDCDPNNGCLVID